MKESVSCCFQYNVECLFGMDGVPKKPCKKCGWNPDVAEERLKDFKKGKANAKTV